MSTEVVEKKARKNPWADMSPEAKHARLEKMNAAKAKKRGEPSTLEELEVAKAEVLKLRAELDEKTRSLAPASNIEVYYEFSRSPKKGTEKIHDLNDPRWAELDDFKREVFGTFLIRETVRAADGSTQVIDRTCLSRRPQAAREMLDRYLTTGDHSQRLTEVVR